MPHPKLERTCAGMRIYSQAGALPLSSWHGVCRHAHPHRRGLAGLLGARPRERATRAPLGAVMPDELTAAASGKIPGGVGHWGLWLGCGLWAGGRRGEGGRGGLTLHLELVAGLLVLRAVHGANPDPALELPGQVGPGRLELLAVATPGREELRAGRGQGGEVSRVQSPRAPATWERAQSSSAAAAAHR